MQPFTNAKFDFGSPINKIIKLQSDFEAEFKSFKNYNEVWVSLFEVHEYRNLAQKAISILAFMPATYLCKQGFSALVEIKSKKRSSIRDVDTLIREAFKTRLLPHFSQIADNLTAAFA